MKKNYLILYLFALLVFLVPYVTIVQANVKKSLVDYTTEQLKTDELDTLETQKIDKNNPSGFSQNIKKEIERHKIDKDVFDYIYNTSTARKDTDQQEEKTSRHPEQIVDDSVPKELEEIEQRTPHKKTAKNKKESAEDEHHIKTKKTISEEETIEFHFENADLQNLITQIESFYNVTFITDEVISPMIQGSKAIKGNKITFKTHKPLNKKQAWDLFITFLEIAGFGIIPDADPAFYHIKTIEKTRKSPIPSFIGVNPSVLEELPDNDQIIRFVYFVENTTVDTLKPIVDSLRSSSSSLIVLQELKAFLITDKAYNIKTLMTIVKELDKVTMPQAMSILKLHRADAQDVKKLYDTLIQTDDKSITARLFPARKQPTSLYFPENIRIIAESRTNALILLGPQDAIDKIEEFIKKNIDVELDKPYAALHTYQLKYADANTIAEIMNKATEFGKNTEAGKSGGVRGGDKYLKPMAFVPEAATNQLIIKSDYEDYLKAKNIIERLDQEQPQVAIEVLILTVSINKTRQLGTQIRNKEKGPDGFLGSNVKFQTSGFLGQGIQENTEGTGSQRLLADLVNLVTAAGTGNTVLTLGDDIFGVWGIFQALQTISNTQVISNPFLVTTSNTKASVSVGETRRVITATIVGLDKTDTFDDLDAKLEVDITPQINSDGMIVLDLVVSIVDFIGETSDRREQRIETKTIVADKEVLALGGIIRNKIDNTMSKTAVLGDIPILGWLFKNKKKQADKDNLLILISTRIVDPKLDADIRQFTRERIDDYYGTLDDMHDISEKRDPVNKLFFTEEEGGTEKIVDTFFFEKENTNPKRNIRAMATNTPKKESRRARIKRERKEKRQQRRTQKNIVARNKRNQKRSKSVQEPVVEIVQQEVIEQPIQQKQPVTVAQQQPTPPPHITKSPKRSLTDYVATSEKGDTP